MRQIILVTVVVALTTPVRAETNCYGDGAYRVCTTTRTDANGNISITSSDNMGNSYSVDTDSYTSSNGRSVVRSQDSMGNSYAVESWSDGGGTYSVDSYGNSCTITTSGVVIGCD